jgi:hypothetical protein
MQRSLLTLSALGLGLLATPGWAARPRAAVQYPEGTRVVIVGRISSQPRNAKFAHERKMQVSVGPHRADYTLHLNDAKIIGRNGGVGQVSDLRDRWWVRAEGRVMSDAKRIEVSRLQVLSKTADNLKGTAYYRAGLPHGYVTAVAGSRQSMPYRR